MMQSSSSSDEYPDYVRLAEELGLNEDVNDEAETGFVIVDEHHTVDDDEVEEESHEESEVESELETVMDLVDLFPADDFDNYHSDLDTDSSSSITESENTMHINLNFAGDAEGQDNDCIPPHELEEAEPEDYEHEDEEQENGIVDGLGILNLEGDFVHLDNVDDNVLNELERLQELGRFIHNDLLRNGFANPPVALDDDEHIDIFDPNRRHNVQREIERIVNLDLNNGLHGEDPRDPERLPIVNRIGVGQNQVIEIRIDEPAHEAHAMPARGPAGQPAPAAVRNAAPADQPQVVPQDMLQIEHQHLIEVMPLNLPQNGHQEVPERLIHNGPPLRVLRRRLQLPGYELMPGPHIVARPVPQRAGRALPQPGPQAGQPGPQELPQPGPQAAPQPGPSGLQAGPQAVPQPAAHRAREPEPGPDPGLEAPDR